MSQYTPLHKNDSSENGQIRIIDEDRLCYLVESTSKGAYGLRTISKSLLKEYIDYFEKHPDTSPTDARNALSGLTQIDKFEYGYTSTLTLMAKMALGKEKVINTATNNRVPHKDKKPHQIIFYGAPGTGKSYTINETTKDESVIRTTFHPDSDYSTFVGAYKPTTIQVTMRDVAGHKIIEGGEEVKEDRIVYEFVNQAFLQAYIQAWKFYAETAEDAEPQKQYLIIEEINRGNCAQVFGDLFQLLDRNSTGFSDYPIYTDTDMKKQLFKAFNGLSIPQSERINNLYNGRQITEQVLKGEILLLPDNLYIWSTMNTSDQSLFPVDSAFKRRWEWQYMPIGKGYDDNGNELNWKISVGTNEYDWWSFIEKINLQIGSTTNSEDKKLGFFFCKAENGYISAETFVGKVIFYLWNDVFKDYGFDGTIFKDTDGGTLSFDKFYKADRSGKAIVQNEKIDLFLSNLGVEVSNNDLEVDAEENDDEGIDKNGNSRLKVRFPDGTEIVGKLVLMPISIP